MESAQEVLCPCCGQPTTVFVDCWAGNQDYVEDCSVCCQAIVLHIRVSEYEVREIRTERVGR